MHSSLLHPDEAGGWEGASVGRMRASWASRFKILRAGTRISLQA